MTIPRLLILVAVLAIGVGLALTNPTMDGYLQFIEQELNNAMNRMDQSTPSREQTMVKTIMRTHGRELLNSLVRPHTLRRNWGLCSLFDTTALGQHAVALGIAGHFIPLKGVDEAILKIGRETL